MSDKELDKLIRRKAKLAQTSMALSCTLNPLLEARYGVHPSEVDCDEIIEALDYTGGDFSLAACDAAMKARGYQRLFAMGMKQ